MGPFSRNTNPGIAMRRRRASTRRHSSMCAGFTLSGPGPKATRKEIRGHADARFDLPRLLVVIRNFGRDSRAGIGAGSGRRHGRGAGRRLRAQVGARVWPPAPGKDSEQGTVAAALGDPGPCPLPLLAEEDLDDVSVFDRVGLPLGAQFAMLARLRHRLQLDQVVVRHHLRPDEAVGEVGVDRAGRIDGR